MRTHASRTRSLCTYSPMPTPANFAKHAPKMHRMQAGLARQLVHRDSLTLIGIQFCLACLLTMVP